MVIGARRVGAKLTLLHSFRKAGSNGERNAAPVAKIETAIPVVSTITSNSAIERVGSLLSLAKNVGAIASRAQKVPVTSPQTSRKRFSARIITARCVRV